MGGEGSPFPFGPTCFFHGVRILCLCDASPHGGMTPEILRKVSMRLDELNIFSREAGKIPVLLFDGDGTPFGLPFLKYINNDRYIWYPVIGVPFGMHKWQLGDSKEQNGKCKELTYDKKDELHQKKH